MNALEDQIARICSQVPPGARVSLTIAFTQHSRDHAPDGIPKRALTTQASVDQKRHSRAQFRRWLENELAERPALDFSFELLDSAQISKRIRRNGGTPLRGKAVHAMLKGMGFVPLGLIRGLDGPANFWSIYPEEFADKNGVIVPSKVRDHMDRL